ncbi:MAG: SMP-30/gluconolactonase/LRE family protein [Bacteroidales bacterium]|nr:SMP-30/gluconolactonase/LRE family protein [Bacteroidales bacterium]
MKTTIQFILAMSLIMVACNSGQKKGSGETTDSEEKQMFQLVERWRTDTILETPESVLYDRDGGALYVSCLANRTEGAGYISKLDLRGNILDLKWVPGLTFPTGMTRVANHLYVAERNAVAKIDIASAEVIQRIRIDTAEFLNDMTSDKEGNLYVSDSQGNAVYKISGDTVSPILSEGNQGPNGLLAEEERLLMTSTGRKVLFAMDYKTAGLSVVADSISSGDGIAFTGFPGHYLVSEWPGQVYMVYPDHTKVSLLYTADREVQTADIEFAADLRTLYVPTFFRNNVVAYELMSE